MLIREAVKADIPQVLELIHEFQDESLNHYSLFCNDEKALKVMEATYPNALVMEDTDHPSVAGKIVGVIAGVIGESIVSTEKVMQELVWFVKKEYRGCGDELLERFEGLSKDRGCGQLLMVHMGNLHRKAFERFYTRRGYELLECQYLKCLI